MFADGLAILSEWGNERIAKWVYVGVCGVGGVNFCLIPVTFSKIPITFLFLSLIRADPAIAGVGY